MRLKYVVFTTLLLFLLSSCLGLKTGIVVNNDGSGTIDLLYTVSETLDSMAKQDGNASEPPLPVSKSDIEKTVSRIEGLSLKSYKTETQGSNHLIQVKLDFDSIDALAAFFDESHETIRYTESGNKRKLVFVFNDEPLDINAGEQELFTKALEAYSFDFSLKTQGNMEAAFIDENGNTLQTAAAGILEVKNNSVSYQIPMADLVFAKEKIIMKIVF